MIMTATKIYDGRDIPSRSTSPFGSSVSVVPRLPSVATPSAW